MRISRRTLLLAAVIGSFVLPAASAEAKNACVWYDVHTPVFSGDDEKCWNVLPDDMNDHHTPWNCPGVPPLGTSACVGADFYMYGG